MTPLESALEQLMYIAAAIVSLPSIIQYLTRPAAAPAAPLPAASRPLTTAERFRNGRKAKPWGATRR